MNNRQRLKGTGVLISEIFSAHPEWNATKVYQRYLILIGDTTKAVTLNAVQKHLEKLRITNKNIDDKGLDVQWHINDPNNDWMDAQSIKQILRILRWKAQRGPDEFNPELTRRQAKWISRIYCIELLKSDAEIWRTSIVCAILERYSELTRISCSTDIESLFMALDSKEYEERIGKLVDKDKNELFFAYNKIRKRG